MISQDSQDIIDQLKNVSISELPKYLKCGKDVLKTIQEVGVKTLNDLWYQDFNQFTKDNGYRYFPLKSAKNIQTNFRNFSEEQLCDILFWNKRHIFPSVYNELLSLESNMTTLLEELIAHIKECCKRDSQIRRNTDKKRIKCLGCILEGLYQKGQNKKTIGKELKLGEERIRLIIITEFLSPLFNAQSLDIEVLQNIAINEAIVAKVHDIRQNRLFERYNINDKDKCIVPFFEDVVGFDILDYQPFTFLVPSRERGTYKSIIRAFISEMSGIMVNKPAEILVEIIGNSKIVQREILNRDKTFEEEFVYQLLYDDSITTITDSSIIIKPEYIVHFGTDDLGDVHQEKALARIMADHNRWMSKEEITSEYNKRYNRNLSVEQVNLTTTEKYGCKPSGKTGKWRYSKDAILNIQEWIEQFAKDHPMGFSMQDVTNELQKENYTYNSEATLRTYITRCCAVHNSNSDYFCHREYITNDSTEWRKRTLFGLMNWMANEIHLLFSQKDVNTLDCETISEYLSERSKGTPYEVGNSHSLKDNCYFLFNTSKKDNPFIIESQDRGKWTLSKRVGVYEHTDWLSYGLKGRSYQRKLINESIHIIRQTINGQMTLSALTKRLKEIIGNDIYEEDTGYELTEQRLRKKLIEFINRNELNHPLTLTKSGKNLLVKLDARLINEQKRYQPIGTNTNIQYCTISQLAEFDNTSDEQWNTLKCILLNELSFCEEWLRDDSINISYNDAVEQCILFLREERYNNNLNSVIPQRLHEFFSVSNPTSIDRYCIMCSIAKNFEGFIDSIARRKLGKRIHREDRHSVKGLYDKTEYYGFNDYSDIIREDIADLHIGTYDHTLKCLNEVRNTDSHGKWYTDNRATDNLSEDERNIQKIRRFAALYIFTYAKYAMQ